MYFREKKGKEYRASDLERPRKQKKGKKEKSETVLFLKGGEKKEKGLGTLRMREKKKKGTPCLWYGERRRFYLL